MFEIYADKKVLVTGHTGFKGSWLTFWLLRLGAQVFGVSLPPATHPNHFELLNFSTFRCATHYSDIRDLTVLGKIVQETRPDIVFHLAAQPLVRRSYHDPVETFSTNIQGTVNLLEACRQTDSVRAIVNITSDKCYENKEWVWGYRESDPMGGYDPYSASKGCSELLTAAWRNSFFHPEQYGKTHQTLLASARAGNVIGGGDWSKDRLIPDIVRAIQAGAPLIIRSPGATRPWQHVLDPLSGYLLLGQRLLEGKKEFARAWNFGPSEDADISVGDMALQFKSRWDAFEYEFKSDSKQPHEAGLLKLDCARARSVLKWRPVWDSEKTIENTVDWYKKYYMGKIIATRDNLEDYLAAAGGRYA